MNAPARIRTNHTIAHERLTHTHTHNISRGARIIVDNRTTRHPNDALCNDVCDVFNAGLMTHDDYNAFLDLFAYVARKNAREGRAYVITCMYETSRVHTYQRAYIHDAHAGITCSVYRFVSHAHDAPFGTFITSPRTWAISR